MLKCFITDKKNTSNETNAMFMLSRDGTERRQVMEVNKRVFAVSIFSVKTGVFALFQCFSVVSLDLYRNLQSCLNYSKEKIVMFQVDM